MGDLRASSPVTVADAAPSAFASAMIVESVTAVTPKFGGLLPGALHVGSPTDDGGAQPWLCGTRGGPRAVVINCETSVAADVA